MQECPCCSGRPFAECCEPLLDGRAQPETAEALMRSRYAAYQAARIDYLRETTTGAARSEFDEESTRRWAATTEWRGLEILRTDLGGPTDETGVVEFVACYVTGGKTCHHHEIADFVRTDGLWRFADGNVVSAPTYRREAPKIGRNMPCPCGSGRKFKRCCAQDQATDDAQATPTEESRA